MVETKFGVLAIKQAHDANPPFFHQSSQEDLRLFSVAFTELKHKTLDFSHRRVRSRCLRKFMVTESRESDTFLTSLEMLSLAHEGKEQSYKGECAGVGDSLTELVRASAVMGMILHRSGRVSGRNQHL